jgi:hypothetical protein
MNIFNEVIRQDHSNQFKISINLNYSLRISQTFWRSLLSPFSSWRYSLVITRIEMWRISTASTIQLWGLLGLCLFCPAVKRRGCQAEFSPPIRAGVNFTTFVSSLYLFLIVNFILESMDWKTRLSFRDDTIRVTFGCCFKQIQVQCRWEY